MHACCVKVGRSDACQNFPSRDQGHLLNRNQLATHTVGYSQTSKICYPASSARRAEKEDMTAN